MADIQREFERRERKAQKDKKRKIIIWIIIAVVIVILAVMKISEININSVLDRFVDSDGNFSVSSGISDDSYPYSLDASKNVSMVNINNKLGIMTPNSFTVLDSKTAETEYGFQHGYSNPVLETSGIYSLVYDQGGNKFRLDTVSASVYEEDTESTVFCANVSKDGDVAVATTAKDALCKITVYSKTLKELFTVSTSDGYVVSAALSENGKKVAFASVKGENADIVTSVTVYNVSSETKEYETVQLPKGNLIDLSFCGNNIFVVGDTYAGVITKSGEYDEIYEAGSISTRSFCYAPSGELVIAFNNFSNSTDNTVSYVKKNGSIKTEIVVSGNIKSVSASSSLISVLTNSDIVSYSISKGEEKEKTVVDDSVKSLCRMGSEVFIQKQSVIDRSEAESD